MIKRTFIATHKETIDTIPELCQQLALINHSLDLAELLELTARLKLPPSEWQRKLKFSSNRFCYRTLYESPYFEVNLIGWRSHQRSSAHDHRGTNCCVLVLDGVLTNRDYVLDSQQRLVETAHRHLKPGEILSRSNRQIHQCGNEQMEGIDLATLHLYSPPLRPLVEREYP